MKKMTKSEELYLSRLKNEEQMLALIESNIKLDCEIEKLQVEEEMEKKLAELNNNFQLYVKSPFMNGMILSFEQLCQDVLKSKLEEINSRSTQLIEKVKEDRDSIVLEAQKMIKDLSKDENDRDRNDIPVFFQQFILNQMANSTEKDCNCLKCQLNAILKQAVTSNNL